jgi:hypothetical protein
MGCILKQFCIKTSFLSVENKKINEEIKSQYRVSTEAVQRQYRDTDSVLSQSLPRGE